MSGKDTALLNSNAADKRIDDMFGKYIKRPDLPDVKLVEDSEVELKVKKRRIAVAIKDTNEMGMLYDSLTQTIDGRVYYAVERRVLNGKGYTIQWMNRKELELI